jgi:exodeoxyribonuclease V beta subunit
MTIRGVPAPALSIRLALGEDIPRSDRGKNPILTPKARVAVYGDMVLQIRQLLDHGTIPDENKEGVDRKITPADIAVLVRTRNESAAVQAALIEQGVPAVQARGVSVLESRAAEQWRTLLWALTNPSDPRRARALALTWFGGWTADQVAVATDEQLTDLQETMQTWSTTLDLHGVTAFVRQIWSESGIAQVVLSGPEGDRHMTDLQHVGELLAQSARLERIGVAGLLALLDVEPESEIDVEGDGDTTARRIESEARAVQVMTVWVAKGLEFPIVCCPTLWGSPRAPATVFIDPVTGIRTFDVANNEEWPDKASAEERKGWARHEALGEQLRLLYVALTRARHHTIVWWSRCQSSEGTALARVLFARSGGAIDPDRFNDPKVDLPDDDDAWGELQPLQHLSEGTIDIGLHGMPLPPAGRWKDPERSLAQPPLELARLERALDRARRRWSFTALTSHAETFTADPSDESLGDGGADDERADDEVETTGQEGDPTQEDPVAGGGTGVGAWPALAQLPAGAGFGTLVHSVLERVDFSAPDLAADLGREVERAHRRAPLDLTPVPDAVGDESTGEELLVRGLMDALQAPLGPPMADLRLIDLTPSQRINEMSFELQLGEHTARPDLRAIGRLVAEGLEPGDPFVEWARALAAGAIVTPLAGHLTGSVDLIFRVPHGEAAGRFVVADYKTNRLSQRGQAPRPGDYQRDGLARAMVEHHYPLQALLYSVVLHRYLSWRLAGYAPEAHLSGAAYLFVRGMGPHDPSTAAASAQPGIFHWNIPPHLVVALSDLLNGMHQWAGAS